MTRSNVAIVFATSSASCGSSAAEMRNPVSTHVNARQHGGIVVNDEHVFHATNLGLIYRHGQSCGFPCVR
jgi:hypothetical protein